ncbi:hypothetical protein Bpfe_018657 [Biomphalaria pfeifferi]|uniref:Uncharacterized protein n=1 Tax=Biomphalaria pfeifferi TaxID=112525 RepID=A0AAD8F4Y1_BIOPF|nr:hypothetical protein Bpfe_018657 [Biomphalaria pfeifferi]
MYNAMFMALPGRGEQERGVEVGKVCVRSQNSPGEEMNQEERAATALVGQVFENKESVWSNTSNLPS